MCSVNARAEKVSDVVVIVKVGIARGQSIRQFWSTVLVPAP